LRTLLEDNENDPLTHIKSLDGTIKSCRDAMQTIATNLGITFEKCVDSEKKVNLTFKKRLRWPWREKKNPLSDRKA